MRSPGFWWRPDQAWPRHLLMPAGRIYGAVTARRMAQPGLALERPVLCIGNLVAGGAGKTPTALWLIERLLGRGERPAVLSRGYGRRSTGHGVLAVDAAAHSASQAGDEPLLLARRAPCFVSADRRPAAQAAIAAGATLLLLDDGLQNPSLAKQASIAVVDGASGIGNGACVPAGPLRAPLEQQWPFVSLMLLIGDGAPGETVAAQAIRHGVAVVRGRLRPDAACLASLRGRRLFAFAGIGRPEKFFRTLEDEGLDVVGRRSFPDHHAFGDADLGALAASAKRKGADLVTTEKDRVRLPAAYPARTLPVRLEIADPAPLDTLIDRVLGPCAAARPPT